MKVISISNNKGGVGKTTSTANIGAGLYRLGKKVLLIDLDPQSNLSQHFGILDAEETVYEALFKSFPLPIKKISEGFDIVPSKKDLAALETLNENNIERLLKTALKKQKQNYDIVLIDTPPSIGKITINALTASDGVIIPLDAESFALKGFDTMVDVITLMRGNFNKTIEIYGSFFTRFDSRKKIHRAAEEFYVKKFSERLYETRIRNNISLSEAQIHGLDIFSYNESCNGSVDYLALSKEISKFLNS